MEIKIKSLTKIFPGDAKKNIRDTIAVKDLDFVVDDGTLGSTCFFVIWLIGNRC